MVGRESLRGYILEEVLAYLVRMSGYSLLIDKKQDPVDLDLRGNGLVVKGRGAYHQVDVLGQLNWIPAFTFPLRLFLEAKFRDSRTGIPHVRNAIGVVLDINENNFPRRDQPIILQKYNYVYALFSTSGFSSPAQDMALAHQISLIDLSSSEYSEMRNAIVDGADAILENRERLTDSNSGAGLAALARYALRSAFPTLPEELAIEQSRYQSSLMSELLSPVVEMGRRYKELFVAMANGPYMLLLRANDPVRFINYCKRYHKHKVAIHYTDSSSPWTINPSDEPTAYELTFNLPSRISDWIFSATRDTQKRALEIKKQIFSSITIYRSETEQDHLFRLEFNPESVAFEREIMEGHRQSLISSSASR